MTARFVIRSPKEFKEGECDSINCVDVHGSIDSYTQEEDMYGTEEDTIYTEEWPKGIGMASELFELRKIAKEVKTFVKVLNKKLKEMQTDGTTWDLIHDIDVLSKASSYEMKKFNDRVNEVIDVAEMMRKEE